MSSRHLWCGSALVLSAVALGACSGDDLGRVFPDVVACASPADLVCAPPLDLGAFRHGEVHEAAVYVRNRGTGILHVSAASLVTGSSLEVGEAPENIAAQTAAPLAVMLTPALGANEATVRIESDDPDSPSLTVEVRFTGVAPALVVCPSEGLASTPASCASDLTVDLGEVRFSQTRDAVFTVRNAGTAALTLTGRVAADASSTAGELAVVTSIGAGTIAPGGDAPLVIRYQPRDGLPDSMVLELHEVAGLIDGASITLQGRTPANLPPVANAVGYISRTATVMGTVDTALWLDGLGSSDPEGDPLVFAWSVVARPAGSTADLAPADATLARFVPDVPGAYIVQLQVADSVGLVGFADTNLDVAAHHGLTVRASWSEGGDVDLHLLPSGDTLFGPTDCFFGRPSVDWGAAGDGADDPGFVADADGPGRGEQIQTHRPSSGSYDIVVGYFDGRAGPAIVTVTVEADDGTVMLGEASRTLAATCDTWLVGTLTWPARTFLTSSAPLSANCGGGTP